MSAIAVVLLVVLWFGSALGIACLFGLVVREGKGARVEGRRAVVYTSSRQHVPTATAVPGQHH